MELITIYEQNPILFWRGVFFFCLAILPWLVAVHFLDRLDFSLKLLKADFMSKDIDNKSAAYIQYSQCGPSYPLLPQNTEHRYTDDPNNNHGSRTGSSKVESNVF